MCCVCTHHCSALRGQKEVSYTLELELEAVCSCLIWVLGIELGSLGRKHVFLTTEPSVQSYFGVLKTDSHSVQAGLKLTVQLKMTLNSLVIFLLPLPRCWDYWQVPLYPLKLVVLFIFAILGIKFRACLVYQARILPWSSAFDHSVLLNRTCFAFS